MSPRVVGLDLSLTSTGWATVHGGLIETGTFTSTAPKALKVRSVDWYDSSLGRIDRLVGRVADLAEGCDLAVVEGLLLHAKGTAVDRMYGMWWLVVAELRRRGITYAVVNVNSLKKYMTGRTADKDAVLAAVIKRLPGDVSGNDEADALALAAMGSDYLGYPIATMPQAHRVALDAVEWPALIVPAVAS